MLDPFSRAAVAGLTAICVAGAIALAPSGARGSLIVALPLRGADAVPAGRAFVPLPIERDPFAEPPTVQPARTVAEPAATGSQTLSARIPSGALPSNLADDVIPAVPGTAPPDETVEPNTSPARITAVVTGAHPYALIETGGVHEIKGIGDRIGGSPVLAIDLDGIRLQNGVRLAVFHGAQP